MTVRNVIQKGSAFVRAFTVDRRPTIAYVGGWLGKGNLGDEALLLGMRELFPRYQFFPDDGGRAAALALRLLPELRGGILGGGTLIACGRESLRLAERHLERGRLLGVFGTGVEDAGFWEEGVPLEQWKPVLDEANFVGVRGPVSAERLHTAGFRNVEIVGDPVLAFATDNLDRSHQSRTLGLNVGASDGKVWGTEDEIASEFTTLATLARQEGWIVRWFVVWPKDLPVTAAIAEKSGTADGITCIFDDHSAFMNQVGTLTAFVGMKLHATVLATCALTPSIMIEYRSKCIDYMRSINQGHHCVRSDRFRGGEVWEKVSAWEESRTGAAEELRDSMRPMVYRQRELARELELQLQ